MGQQGLWGVQAFSPRREQARQVHPPEIIELSQLLSGKWFCPQLLTAHSASTVDIF